MLIDDIERTSNATEKINSASKIGAEPIFNIFFPLLGDIVLPFVAQ